MQVYPSGYARGVRRVAGAVRDRSKSSKFLGRDLGKIFLEKDFTPLFVVKKKSSPPIFFEKKTLSPPFLFLLKTALRIRKVMKTNQCIFCMYHYANEHTRVTWPNIDYFVIFKNDFS